MRRIAQSAPDAAVLAEESMEPRDPVDRPSQVVKLGTMALTKEEFKALDTLVREAVRREIEPLQRHIQSHQAVVDSYIHQTERWH